MNVLVVGDVHGCYHTFEKLISKHWKPEKEFLVQVGDFINKGRHSALTVKYARKLQKKYPYQVFFLLGNHENYFLEFWDKPEENAIVAKTVRDFLKHDINLKKVAAWMSGLPLKWETPDILVTHAGISERVKKPYSASNPFGVLHNRSPLRNTGKTQIFGHRIQEDGKMVYFGNANAWCVDSGAWTGNKLSAIRLSNEGEVIKHIQVETLKEDLKKKS